MDRAASLRRALEERVLILDGAMGTMIQRSDLPREAYRYGEELNLTRPELIRSIHEQYIAAGADIISTNSFGANAIALSEYGDSPRAAQMAFQAACLARQAADSASRQVWVAGSMGPTGKSLTMPSDIGNPDFREVDFMQMEAAYEEQIEALSRGGVDLLLVETCFDALNAKAAVYAARAVAPHLPIIISVSVSDRSGRTLTGQTIEAFYRSVEHAGLLAFGLNCSFGASDLKGLLVEVVSFAACPLIFYPNAGLPNEMGQYDQSPEQMATQVADVLRTCPAGIVGGCCGSTPEHIKAVAAVVGREVKSRHRTAPAPHFSGLESVSLNPDFLTNVGERTNVAGSRKFARLIAEKQYDEALQVAADQIEGGADIIDINMDDAMLEPTAEMRCFLRHISGDPAVARAAIMIDSSHFETIIAGLQNAQGKCIVNSISLKEGEQEFLRKAREIARYGAAVVVMAFDEKGQATTFDRKIEICSRAYDLLVGQAGYRPHDIIFDVNVLSIGTGIAEHARYGIDFIEAVRWIKANLPGALTSGGISNLSFAFRGNNPVREAMHSAFLFHARRAGLDMAIVNPSMLQVYDSIDPALLRAVEDVIFDTDPEATERLIELASGISGPASASGKCESAPLQPQLSARERLVQALVSGRSATLQEDLLSELSSLGKAVSVIEGPLMEGMEKVGKLFADGKMFLPQVVKSAKVMRDAVSVLRPYMAEDNAEGTRRPKVVIATVQGDVHDIGKNITAIVLSCNGFDVTDLGVMVPVATIFSEAEKHGADIIAASGLITPSLSYMEELCRIMAAAGSSKPLFIGGATTSALHTAVKLAPLYDHVFYGPDASASAVMASRYISDPDSFEAEQHAAQAELRELYSKRSGASAQAPSESPGVLRGWLQGSIFSDIPFRSFTVGELLPYFDWRMLYAVWGFKYAGGENEHTLALRRDASALLEELEKNGGVTISLSLRFLDCHSEGDDIVWEGGRIPMLRQEDGDRRCLADFVAPGGESSQVGLFAVSVHRAHRRRGVCDCLQCSGGEGYDSLLERSVRLTLAEAVSSWLDAVLYDQLPSEPARVKIVKPAAGYASCPDHSLKRDILSHLDRRLDISLTESYAMVPDASICGLVFAHPLAGYPEIRGISLSSLEDYLRRRPEAPRAFLEHLLK